MDFKSAIETLSILKSGDNVFIHTAAAVPQELVRAFVEKGQELKNISIYKLHTEGAADYTKEAYANSFEEKAFFVGSNSREAIQQGRGSYIPIFLSEISSLFQKRNINIDIALISVSPPDKHGYCSLGVSVDITKSVLNYAKVVVAQVNNNMPRSHGDGLIHVSTINHLVSFDEVLPEIEIQDSNPIALMIGEHISSVIENGSNLQLGIGDIPNAVLASLSNHKDLGIHSEMFSDGVIELIQKGVINGSNKVSHIGQIVASFVVGTKMLYDFIDDNPMVKMLESSFVNDVKEIATNPKVVSINSAIEIDLTGQVCADSIGHKIYSGVGGQIDFVRGAKMSKGGKSIIALCSRTKKGYSKIVPTLKNGAGVVTTRADLNFIATEFGIANLFGKSIKERAKILIELSHPEHRDRLTFDAKKINIL